MMKFVMVEVKGKTDQGRNELVMAMVVVVGLFCLEQNKKKKRRKEKVLSLKSNNKIVK